MRSVQKQLMMRPLQPPRAVACSRLTVWCGISVTSAARRKRKQRRQQGKAEKVWQSQTSKQQVQYQVVVPPPGPFTASPPQFYDPEPLAQHHDVQWMDHSSGLDAGMQAGLAELDDAVDRQLNSGALAVKGRKQPQRKPPSSAQMQPGPVQQPAVTVDALWLEKRRSAQEQQEYRQQRKRKQQAAAKPQRRVPSMAELLATSDQIEELRQEGYAVAQKSNSQQLRGQAVQQQGQLQLGSDSLVASLSTDLLWMQLQEVRQGRQSI